MFRVRAFINQRNKHFQANSPKKNKYGAKKTVVDGYRFDSIKEAKYYSQLKIRALAGGDVLFFLRQVPFHLPGNVIYRCDFQVFYKDGRIAFIDVKGHITKAFIRDKKQVEALYPVIIETR